MGLVRSLGNHCLNHARIGEWRERFQGMKWEGGRSISIE